MTRTIVCKCAPLQSTICSSPSHFQARRTHIHTRTVTRSTGSTSTLIMSIRASPTLGLAHLPCRRRFCRSADLGYSTAFAKRAGSLSHPQARSFRGDCGSPGPPTLIFGPTVSTYKGRISASGVLVTVLTRSRDPADSADDSNTGIIPEFGKPDRRSEPCHAPRRPHSR